MNGYNWQTGDPNNFVAAPATWAAGEGDPSTWTQTSNQYRDEWQSGSILDITTSINNKMGWVILDLGILSNGLDEMYIWNGRQIGTRAMEDFNIYTATAPIVPVSSPTNSTSVDYDFGVAAWTQLGSTKTLSDGGATVIDDGVYSFGGIDARYVGIEILNRHDGTSATNTRVGFAEVAFTAVPEPSTTALLGLGGLALILRRRR